MCAGLRKGLREPTAERASASRGIAIVPVERPLGRDDGDSSTAALRACARNDDVGCRPLAAWPAADVSLLQLPRQCECGRATTNRSPCEDVEPVVNATVHPGHSGLLDER